MLMPIMPHSAANVFFAAGMSRERVQEWLAQAGVNGRTIAGQFVFGDCRVAADVLRGVEQAAGPLGWPVTWVDGNGHAGRAVTGQQVWLAEPPCAPILVDGRLAGVRAVSADMDVCLLGDIAPPDPSASRADQTTAVFERMEGALAACGMNMNHLVRTWLFLDRITDWYTEFNTARTRFLEARGVMDGLVPASTGVGVANRHGAALAASALAIRPLSSSVTARTVPSPLQCEAIRYRSAFSRAVELAAPGGRCLFVSGTASIAPGGANLHEGHVDRQVEQTLDVVAALLESRGMDWACVNRAIVYLKRLDDLPAFERVCRARGLEGLEPTVVQADICRDALLFEIELDAVAE